MYKSTKISSNNYAIEKRISILGMWGVWITVETFNGTGVKCKSRIKELRNSKNQAIHGIFSILIG